MTHDEGQELLNVLMDAVSRVVSSKLSEVAKVIVGKVRLVDGGAVYVRQSTDMSTPRVASPTSVDDLDDGDVLLPNISGRYLAAGDDVEVTYARSIADGVITRKLGAYAPYEGLVYRGYAKSFSTDFNDITEQGVYYLDNTTMANAPSNYKWAYMLVMTNHGTIQVTQMVVYTTSSSPMQVISTRNYSGSPAAWGTWRTPRTIANGDLSGTGTFANATPDPVSHATGVWKTLASVTLTKGRWVVSYAARWNTNANGRRKTVISTAQDSNSSYGMIADDTRDANANDVTFCKAEFTPNVTADSVTYYLNGYQDSGSALTAYGRIYAVKIC